MIYGAGYNAHLIEMTRTVVYHTASGIMGM